MEIGDGLDKELRTFVTIIITINGIIAMFFVVLCCGLAADFEALSQVRGWLGHIGA